MNSRRSAGKARGAAPRHPRMQPTDRRGGAPLGRRPSRMQLTEAQVCASAARWPAGGAHVVSGRRRRGALNANHKNSLHEKLRQSAVVQYAGIPGSSSDCRDAVTRLLQYGDRITQAKILTHDNEHAFLLTVNEGDQIIIKSGFASGYGGTGPSTFSYVLQLLEACGVEIDEFAVTEEFIHRVEYSCLRASDLATLDRQRPVRPSRWRDYILERHWGRQEERRLWEDEFPAIIPFAIVDPRLIDLALTFWNAPSDHLLTAFRRLEDVVRRRTGLKDRSGKLFARAFLGDGSPLRWEGCDESERASRGELFRNAFTAFRNPRAHGERDESAADQLCEFLLVNHLFRLERAAVEVATEESPRGSKAL